MKILKIIGTSALATIFVFIAYVCFKPSIIREKPSPQNRSWQEYQLELASKKLRKGMTGTEVLSIVGTPDFKHDSTWSWRGAEDTNNQYNVGNAYYDLMVTFSNQVVSEYGIHWINYVP